MDLWSSDKDKMRPVTVSVFNVKKKQFCCVIKFEGCFYVYGSLLVTQSTKCFEYFSKHWGEGGGE